MRPLIFASFVVLVSLTSAFGQEAIRGEIGAAAQMGGPDLGVMLEGIQIRCTERQSCEIQTSVTVTNLGQTAAGPSTLHITLDVPPYQKRSVRPGELSSNQLAQRAIALTPAVGSPGCETPTECRQAEERARRAVRTTEQLFRREDKVGTLLPGESWTKPLALTLHNSPHDILLDQRPIVEQLYDRTLQLSLSAAIVSSPVQASMDKNTFNNRVQAPVPFPR